MALSVEVKKQVYETPRTGFNWLIPFMFTPRLLCCS